MRDEDKPFICYQQGWNIKIMPRNAAGWRAFGLWMLAILMPTFAMIPLAARLDDTPYEYIVVWATVPFLLVMGVTIFAMIRWMKARSEIVDLDAMLEIKREQERQAKKRGRL
jgi:hypothetical protein